MNASQFMDKQIMDLSSSAPPPSSDIDLMNNNDSKDDDDQKQRESDDGLELKKEEIVPSYDFHPIRPNSAVGLSHSALDLAGSTTFAAARVRDDSEPNSTSLSRGFGSFGSIGPAKLVSEKDQNVLNATIMLEIDRTMKKHADNLLHVMEGVSARLTQLETRTHDLENLVDDLKVSVENSHGNTDGKMRQLENILLEVQSGVQLLKDKQDIVAAQLQLSKLQVSKVEGQQQPKLQSAHVDPPTQQPVQVPMQHVPQFPANSFPHPPASNVAPPSPPQQFHQPPSSQQSLPPSSPLAQPPSQFSPHQEPYFPPPNQGQPPPPNQPPYPGHQIQPPHQPPYQSPPQQPQYPQQPPPQLQPSSGYNPEEQPPYPMQSYPPNHPRQPPAGSAPSHQYFNGPPPQPSAYDGAGGRSHSGFPSGYSSEHFPHTGSPSSNYGTPSVKPPHMSSSGTGYPQLSNSRPLPHALPTASAVNSGGSTSPTGSGGRVPVDDVIDKVTTMGFPRDHVRETVRKLTENGQAVDLNVVLDKLMNEGGAPPGGWFGGR